MSNINNIITGLELAQIGWVVPNIYTGIDFLRNALSISGFPIPENTRAQDLGMKYYGKVVNGEWLTTQTFNGGTFIELIQPVSGQSIFHDYIAKNPLGGIQHLAFRLPVIDFNKVNGSFEAQGFAMISEVDHTIARMAFFDTYQTIGVATEIMGITPEGWISIEQMKKTH